MTAVVFYVYLGNCGREIGARSAEIDLLAHVRRQTAMLLKMWLTNTSILRLSEFGHSVLLEEWFVWLFFSKAAEQIEALRDQQTHDGNQMIKNNTQKMYQELVNKGKEFIRKTLTLVTDLTVGRYDLIWF